MCLSGVAASGKVVASAQSLSLLPAARLSGECGIVDKSCWQRGGRNHFPAGCWSFGEEEKEQREGEAAAVADVFTHLLSSRSPLHHPSPTFTA